MKEPTRVLQHNDIFTLVERSFRYEFTPEMLARHLLCQIYASGTISLTMETPKKSSSLSGSVFSISEVPSSPATPKTPIPAARPSVSFSNGQSPLGSAVVDNEITTSPKLSPKVVKMVDSETLSSVTPFSIVGASSLGMNVISSTDHHVEFDKESICETGIFEAVDTDSKHDFSLTDAEAVCTESVCAQSVDVEVAKTEIVITEITESSIEAHGSVEAEIIAEANCLQTKMAEITELSTDVESSSNDSSIISTTDNDITMSEEVIPDPADEIKRETAEMTEVQISCEATEMECETASYEAIGCTEVVREAVESAQTCEITKDMDEIETVESNESVETNEMIAEASESIEAVDKEVEPTEMVVDTVEVNTEAQDVESGEIVTDSTEAVHEFCEATETAAEARLCEAEASVESAVLVETIEEKETFESVEMPLTQEHNVHEYIESCTVAPVDTEMSVAGPETDNGKEGEVSPRIDEVKVEESANEAVVETTAPQYSITSSFVCSYESSDNNSMEGVEVSEVVVEPRDNEIEAPKTVEAAAGIEAPKTVEAAAEIEAPEEGESAIMTAEPVEAAESETVEAAESEAVETAESETVEAVESKVPMPETISAEAAGNLEASIEPFDVEVEIALDAGEVVEGSEIASVEIEAIGVVSIPSSPKARAASASVEESSTPGPLRKSTRVHLTPAALESVKKQHGQSDSPLKLRRGHARSTEESGSESENGNENNFMLSDLNENNADNSETRTSTRGKKAKLDETPATPVRRSGRARVTTQK